METNRIICGDTLVTLKTMPSDFVDCICTSPPYWGLRDYGVNGQLGLEPTLDEYIEKLLAITAELKRVLRPTGTMWWNMGDCYAGSGGPGGDYNEGGLREGQPKPEKREWLDPKLPARKRGRETVNQNSFQPKCKVMQNYRLILRMIDDQGWILRNIIVWNKPNHMPSSVKDRLANSYEPVFFLVKNRKYWFDLDAIRVPCTDQERLKSPLIKPENPRKRRIGDKWTPSINPKTAEQCRINMITKGKNPGDVFTIPTQPFSKAHFAVYPEKLIEPFIKAGCPEGGIVLDPFSGAGTTAVVAKKLGRNYIGIDISPDYCKMAEKQIANTMGKLI